MPPSEQAEEEEDSGPLDLSTPYPITLTRVALDNVNIKIDDTTVSVMDFTSGLNWQEKTLTLKPTSLKGLLIALPKVAEVAQEEVVEPKIEIRSRMKTAGRNAERPLFSPGITGDDRRTFAAQPEH